MKSKEFDDIVRQKFENARLPYNHENWHKLSATLDKKKERNIRLLLWPLASIAASVAMAIGIFTWVNKDEKEIAQVKGQETRHTTQVATAPVQQRMAELAPAPPTRNTPQRNNPTPAVPQNRVIALSPSIQEGNEVSVPQTQVVAQQQTPAKVQVVEEQANTFRAEKEVAVLTPDINPMRALPVVHNNTYYEELVTRRNNRKQFVAITGGLNYGTLNSGYVMGVSGGTKLGAGKFFVEGDVAFVGNMANEKSKHTFKNKASAISRSTSYNTSTVTVQRFYNLYYAQVTPTLGYHVARSLSVGLGADVQKLLINDILITETDNPDDAKQLPVYDMGLVGKTEYSVTKEIKASVYYRKAMNQSLTGNSKLLNRDYLQLQLKFTIFNR